jgi:hypothetical protein
MGINYKETAWETNVELEQFLEQWNKVSAWIKTYRQGTDLSIIFKILQNVF